MNFHDLFDSGEIVFSTYTPTECDHKENFSLECNGSTCFQATGASSRFLESRLKPIKCDPGNCSIPYDRDDFDLCAILLKKNPSWDIRKVRSCSTQWSNLVDHWKELIDLYEDGFTTKLNQRLEEIRDMK